MLDRFDQVIIDRESVNFERNVLACYRLYGSWENASNKERFVAFPNRRLPADRRIDLSEQTPPHKKAPQTNSFDLRAGRTIPAPFVVTDLDGLVWIPSRVSRIGDMVSAKDLRSAQPLVDDRTGEQIGYLIAAERMALTDLEDQYLSSLRDS